MKRISFIVTGLVMMFIVSCNRDKEGSIIPRALVTKEKILGTWKLDRTEDRYYMPVNTLVDTEIYPGEPGDSVVFRSDNIAVGYEEGYSQYPDMYEYRITGLSTISIDDEDYKVTKLTETELHLYIEEIEDGEKWTSSVFLYR